MRLIAVLKVDLRKARPEVQRDVFEARCKFLASVMLVARRKIVVPTTEEFIGLGLLARDGETPKRSYDNES